MSYLKKYNRFGIGTICRICLTQSPKGMVPLDNCLKEECSYPRVFEAMEYVMSSRVMSDKRIPGYVCPMCLGLLKISYDLKMTFCTSQESLRQFYEEKGDSIDDLLDMPVSPPEKIEPIILVKEEEKPAPVELVLGDQKFDINDVVIVVENDEEDDKSSFDAFLNNLGNTVSAQFVKKEENRKYVEPKPEVLIEKVDKYPVENMFVIDDTEESDDDFAVETDQIEKIEECGIDISDLETVQNTGSIDLFNSALNMSFRCKKCGRYFSREGRIKRHLRFCGREKTRKKYKCTMCSKRFILKNNLIQHIQTQHVTLVEDMKSTNTVSKEESVREFRSQSDLEAHQSEDRSNDENDQDGSDLSESELNNIHKLEVSELNMSDIDGVTINSETDMNLLNSALKMKYQCKKCTKCFLTLGRIKRHLKHCGKEKLRMKFKCMVCQRRFILRDNLVRHIKKEHSSSIDDMSLAIHEDSAPALQCKICKVVCRTKSALVYHTLKHGKRNYMCEVCGKHFYTKNVVKIHMQSHQKKETRRLCPICGKGFHYQSGLLYHMRIHNNERKYKCEYCDKRFYAVNGWKRHMRTHTGQKPYPCSYCERGFASIGEKKKHEFLHTGERPYSCDFCKRGFTSKYNCKIHMTSHRGEYDCDHCKKSFVTRDVLSFHLKFKHRIGVDKYQDTEDDAKSDMNEEIVNENDNQDDNDGELSDEDAAIESMFQYC